MEQKRIQELVHGISQEFNGILRENLYELSLQKEELMRLRKRKRELRNALKNCGVGDLAAKEYVKSLIKTMLSEKFLKEEVEVHQWIPFHDRHSLTVKDKFDLLLYVYKKEYGADGFVRLLEEYQLLEQENATEKYEITETDISDVYDTVSFSFSYDDKLNILTQKIYESYRGLGIVDELRDMRLDGISGGVSGAEGDYRSVWAFVKGKTVHLSFLDFENEVELERVCMNIYRYNHPGQLSMNKGYIVNEMKDHSRVVVARPPFCESFVFFVRKFDTIQHKTLDELITDPGCEIPMELLKWIVKGCQITAVTGAQGTGKTTLLMALIGFIPSAYTLRIQELAFELHLRDVYGERNIVTFQETDCISGQEGLDLQKKTDGVVNILGEVATAPVAAWLIQMSMVASLFTMFTHHAKTTKNLIKYMRNCLLTDGAFRNEQIAEEQVVDTIRFDVHLEKDASGHRYIERITEIIPLDVDQSSEVFSSTGIGRPLFKLQNLVEYQNGKYVRCGSFSDASMELITKHLTMAEQEAFYEAYSV